MKRANTIVLTLLGYSAYKECTQQQWQVSLQHPLTECQGGRELTSKEDQGFPYPAHEARLSLPQ